MEKYNKFNEITSDKIAFDLGCNYCNGLNGYPKDFSKAMEYYKRAVELGNVDAMNNIGDMYVNGKGVQINIPVAIQWFMRALDKNPKYGMAAYNLGIIYLNGNGVKINYQLAYNYFNIAIKFGEGKSYYGYACYFAGSILLNNFNKPKDSVALFLKAVEHNKNIAGAWNNLGYLCENNVFETKQGYTARYYYTKAAKLGLGQSMDALGNLDRKLFALGKLKGSGELYEKRYTYFATARNWYNEAIEAGYKPAKKHLELLYYLDSSSTKDYLIDKLLRKN